MSIIKYRPLWLPSASPRGNQDGQLKPGQVGPKPQPGGRQPAQPGDEGRGWRGPTGRNPGATGQMGPMTRSSFPSGFMAPETGGFITPYSTPPEPTNEELLVLGAYAGAVALSALDGPFPFGEAAGVGLIGLATQ